MIVKRARYVKQWNFDTTCLNCGAELTVGESDCKFETSWARRPFAIPVFRCCECGHPGTIPSTEVPGDVQERQRDKSPSHWIEQGQSENKVCRNAPEVLDLIETIQAEGDAQFVIQPYKDPKWIQVAVVVPWSPAPVAIPTIVDGTITGITVGPNPAKPVDPRPIFRRVFDRFRPYFILDGSGKGKDD